MPKISRSSRRPGASETAKIREFFNAYDTDKNGSLSVDELEKLLLQMDIKMSPESVREFFAQIDVDNSNQIEFGEFLDWYTTIVELADEEAQKTIKNLQKTTSFSLTEIEAMYENYKTVSSSVVNDGAIDKEEFRQMMLAGAAASWDSFLVDGLFRMFDRDNSGTITFAEFVENLSLYHNKTKNATEDKHKYLFQIYDVDRDGKISRQDLTKILNDCLCCNNMQLSEPDVLKLVEATFKRNGCGDFMDLQAYLKEVNDHNLL